MLKKDVNYKAGEFNCVETSIPKTTLNSIKLRDFLEQSALVCRRSYKLHFDIVDIKKGDIRLCFFKYTKLKGHTLLLEWRFTFKIVKNVLTILSKETVEIPKIAPKFKTRGLVGKTVATRKGNMVSLNFRSYPRPILAL